MKQGHVTLVGAGCGPDLITVKGLRAVEAADVVFYDDLLARELLPGSIDAEKWIYVGKRSGQHSKRQEEINDLLIQAAEAGQHVVRLKGGDSFVFGRGGEEILALKKAGIPYEVIPGITSSVAVPEHAGIPVTHRKDARSFTVVTGHTADGEEENFEALAKLNGTLVFLMGLKNAGHIAEELMRFGKRPDTPAAVISCGYRPDEKRYDCTLATLGETAACAKTPAILVIGKTAAFHMEAAYAASSVRLRAAVTGTEHFTKRMETLLCENGAEVQRISCLELVPNPSVIPKHLSDYEWIILTSANGVNLLFETLKQREYDFRQLAGMKFAVIGSGTAESLKKYGFCADFVPSEYISDVFGREFGRYLNAHATEKPVLILRAENGAAALTEELKSAGVRYEEYPVYQTRKAKTDLSEIQADYITFSSAAGVRAYFEDRTLPEHCVPVCIGPSTREAFEQFSSRPCLMPKEHTAKAVADLILEHYAHSERM